MGRIGTFCGAGLFLWASISQAIAQIGRAEVTVAVPATAMKAQLINEMMNRGYSIMSDSPNLIIFDRVADNLGAMFLFGTTYGGPPHARIVYSLAEIGGSTRVMADAALIGNAGTAFERRNDMNSGQTLADMQGILNAVAFKATPAPPSLAPEPGRQAVREMGNIGRPAIVDGDAP